MIAKKTTPAPLRYGVGWLGLLAVLGACARAGDPSGAGDLFEGGTSPPSAVPSGSSGDPFVAPSDPNAGVADGGGGADANLRGDAPFEAAPDEMKPTGDAIAGDAFVANEPAPVVEGVADGEAEPGADSSDALIVVRDAGADEPTPTCAQTCSNGCCDSSGACIAGTSDRACGIAAAACQDCSLVGQTCHAQACQAAPAQPPPVEPAPSAPDATPPACNAASCSNLCVPYFVQCCKADDTCGCALLFPRGSCN